MDFNELFARHQTAMSDMVRSISPDGRAWAEECADYYAGRIIDAREAGAKLAEAGAKLATEHGRPGDLLRG